MTSVRIVAIALALCACQALAQQPVKGTLSVVVTDQTGAWISGARITAIETQPGARFEAIADGNGQAVLQMNQGSYELRIRAVGFRNWEDGKVGVDAGTQRTATLDLAQNGCPMVFETTEMPSERPVLATEIPLIPMQQFNPPAKPLRHRAWWFK